jgi:hypothetical protein
LRDRVILSVDNLRIGDDNHALRVIMKRLNEVSALSW